MASALRPKGPELTRRVLSVPKKELDKMRAKEAKTKTKGKK